MPYSAPTNTTTPPPEVRTNTKRGGDRVYKSARWLKVRRMVLRRQPICADPHGVHRATGEVVPALDVDHIRPLAERPDLAFTLTNLRGLCRSCHSRITRGGGRGHKLGQGQDLGAFASAQFFDTGLGGT